MKLTTQLPYFGLLTLLHSTGITSAAQCEVVTTQDSVPSYPVALQEYSYCGGYLNVTAWIQNVNYNKVVQFYYADSQGNVTPLNMISLGWIGMVDGTNNGWEYWAADTPRKL